MKSIRYLCVCLLTVCFTSSAFGEEKKTTEVKSDAVNVYFPAEDATKLPVVFFAHNGGAKKEDWGEFPQKLAAEGFLTASIGWTSFGGSTDLKGAIENVLKTYAEKIDPTRVAFIGGCHGGVKMVPLMTDTAASYQVKTAAFLSVSEPINLPPKHVPVLGVYSTEDRLGKYYKDFTKKLVEEVITEPKKAVAIKGSPHGNELVTDKGSGAGVQTEITAWLKKYLEESR